MCTRAQFLVERRNGTALRRLDAAIFGIVGPTVFLP